METLPDESVVTVAVVPLIWTVAEPPLGGSEATTEITAGGRLDAAVPAAVAETAWELGELPAVLG